MAASLEGAGRKKGAERHDTSEKPMKDEVFNLSVRKFLKSFGLNAQREIEQAVAKAMESGTIKGTETLPANLTLEIAGLKLSTQFKGEIALE